MTEEMLHRANQLKKKINDVSSLIEGLERDNVLTIGVGMYLPMRYNAEVADPEDKVQLLEQRVYERVKDMMVAYKSALEKEFEELN